ncbi:MAG: SDR family oxidoreductase [Dehalococcoidales bacterium]|nr:SDR family oxidoreductase [Dehalococcoidales bacterium]
MTNLKGKVALVTGAAAKKSMGRSVAVRLAMDGANVGVMDKFALPNNIWPGDENWGGLDAVAEEIKAQGKEGLAIVGDVSVSQDVDAAVAKMLTRFGKIDILVHCVGVRGPIPVPAVELDENTWRMLLDVNLTGAFLMCRAVARTMIPDGAGKKIVLVSSQAGIKAYMGGIGYCAAKHGVLGLMKTLSAELAQYKINVNAINPGAFETNFRDDAVIKQAKDLGISVAEATQKQVTGPTGSIGPKIPLGRMGMPEDIANLVSFLVSEESNYITGEDINITGGL